MKKLYFILFISLLFSINKLAAEDFEIVCEHDLSRPDFNCLYAHSNICDDKIYAL